MTEPFDSTQAAASSNSRAELLSRPRPYQALFAAQIDVRSAARPPDKLGVVSPMRHTLAGTCICHSTRTPGVFVVPTTVVAVELIVNPYAVAAVVNALSAAMWVQIVATVSDAPTVYVIVVPP